MSEPWGRWIEGEVQNIQRQADRLGLDSSNDGRINNSSMDQMALQINELQARSANGVAAPPMTISVPTGDTWYYGTTTIALPAPAEPRWGLFSISATTQSTAEPYSLYLRAEINGNLLVSRYDSAETRYDGRIVISGYSALPISDAGTVDMVITCGIARWFGATFTSLRVEDINASVSYAQRV